MSPRRPEEELAELDRLGLRRTLRPLDGPPGPQIRREGLLLLQFGSNDYLGLAGEPRIAEAMIEAIRRFGSGSTASRLVAGSLRPHHDLEDRLAAAKGAPAALTFSSGFSTATGAIPAIVGKGDFVLLDKLCHACLIDGARLSGATLRVFPHQNVDHLRQLLHRIRGSHPRARILIVTESVFSMDGDVCPLREMVALRQTYDALLFLDEAHGFGVLGDRGMGLAEACGLQQQVDFQMGTFSKAAGLAGAYLTLPSLAWRDLLIVRTRSFMFSTAPPAALAAGALASLELILSADGSVRRHRLHNHLELLRPQHPTPILPIVLGSNDRALAASAALEEQGFLVPAIRYPTVPRGSARLRISLSASHSTEEILRLREACRRLDLDTVGS